VAADNFKPAMGLAGAAIILRDFTDLDRVRAALEVAPVPAPESPSR